MFRKLFLLIPLILFLMFGVAELALGTPLPSEYLKVGTVIDIGKELVNSSSMYNPRSFDGKNYVVQINSPQRGTGCYPVGSSIYEAIADIGDGAELRMAGAFPAAGYVLFSGGADNDYFSRIDPNLNLDTRVLATNLDVRPSSFDWVDDDTIIHNSYKSGLRSNLYLTDVNPEPFQVAANTSWNANGYVTTGATARIRNVRVGDIYNGYAYYGDAGVNTAGFWAIDLATGVSTQLGTINVTGDGSWGLWTVKEVNGFLYVHTTHDGINIYNMTNATTLGALHTTYTKDELDALAEDTNPNWGFDVVDDGARMLLSAGVGRVIEIVDSRIADAPDPPNGAVDVKQTSILSWSPGETAASHDVYFGADADSVKNADAGSPEYKSSENLGSESYDPGKLEWNTAYYWRIDEVEDDGTIHKGNLWSFTTADFLLIDNFEEYDAGDNQIWYVWHDGLGYGTLDSADYYVGNGTGAAVGDETTPSYTEETIVHGGTKSMPLAYDNNKQGYAYYSEVEHTLTDQRDWTEEGVAELSLWFRGYPASSGGFIESPLGTFTMTGSGADIWDIGPEAGKYHDEFHFAYKMLTGAGSIVAKVNSVQNTNGWAKVGVMIRETLDADSKHAFACITPENGVASQGRQDTGAASFNYNQTGIAVPYWLKLERNISGSFTVSHSANGSSWQPVTGATAQTIPMGTNVYIGLAVTSHDAALTCQAVFTNVTITGNVSGQWASQNIGILSNDAESMYIAVSNTTGNPGVVVYDDPAAAQIGNWTEWVIPLQAFADQGINLADVDKIAIGLGTRGNMTFAGGSGKIYFDDIRLYRPRPEPLP
jgi:hypothetical protein